MPTKCSGTRIPGFIAQRKSCSSPDPLARPGPSRHNLENCGGSDWSWFTKIRDPDWCVAGELKARIWKAI
jgi:hypothetical protein